MTVVETVLVFAGIPAGVLLLVAAAVLGPSAMQSQSRYRPGRAWGHDPAWWLPDPDAVGPLPAGVYAERLSHARAIAATTTAETADRAGATAADARAAGEAEVERRASAAVGGASGEW